MTEQEIRDLLTEALESLFEIEPERIKPETNLYEDLEIDSIDAIDLIDHIKRKTGHKLQAEDFRNVRTVDDVVKAVLKISQSAQYCVKMPQPISLHLALYGAIRISNKKRIKCPQNSNTATFELLQYGLKTAPNWRVRF